MQSLWGLLGGLASATPPSRLPPSLLFLLPSPSSLPAPALITDAAVTNFHLAGAAPRFAQGGILWFNDSPRVFQSTFSPVVVGPPGSLLGASWKLLGDVLGRPWALLRRLAPSEATLEASRGRLGALLGSSWAVLGASWAVLEAFFGRLGALLGRLGALLEAYWAVLGPSWKLLGPSWLSESRKWRER